MIITQTPLRLSLLGGNTDFREYYREHGGLVLTSTIDKYIYCIVKKRFDEKIIVNYMKKEIVDSVEEIEHDLVREAMKLTGVKKGVEISFLADIPSEGTGLGSSSAVTVGVLNALYTLRGQNVSSWKLATDAIRIELEVLKKPIGVQDQWAVAYGGLRTIELKKNDKIKTESVDMTESVKEDFNNSLMLFYTNTERRSEDVLKTLKLDADTLDHNKKLADWGRDALTKGDLKRFGYLLEAYWAKKKSLSNKVSNTEIDEMYSFAKDAGAIGGKVIGAGGGGFLLVMFPANKRAKVRNALKDYRELPFRFNDFGSRVIFNV